MVVVIITSLTPPITILTKTLSNTTKFHQIITLLQVIHILVMMHMVIINGKVGNPQISNGNRDKDKDNTLTNTIINTNRVISSPSPNQTPNWANPNGTTSRASGFCQGAMCRTPSKANSKIEVIILIRNEGDYLYPMF